MLRIRSIAVAFLLSVSGILIFSPAGAQELEPRRWTHLPTDINIAGGVYAYTDGDISVDPVLRVEGLKKEVDTWAAAYIRTFKLFGKSARLGVVQGWQDGTWTGTVDGVAAEVTRQGWTDTSAGIAVHLIGAPPLSGKEFSAYRAKVESETMLGVALEAGLPTGDYMDDKLINIGSNRFSFRPQIGGVHNVGKWSFEGTGSVAFFTDNNSFFNGNKLEQDPLFTGQGHVVYTFRPGLYVAGGAAIDAGGRSHINGERQDDYNRVYYWGVSAGYSITPRLGLKVGYISSRTQTRTGADNDRVVVGFSTFW